MSRPEVSSRRGPRGISSLVVEGYKSINDELPLRVRPLTVLAGANSSGKSSAIQPLLLVKQTLEATYDPGPLRLDGPNVRFTEAQQLFHRLNTSEILDEFHVGMGALDGSQLSTFFRMTRSGIEVVRTEYVPPTGGGSAISLHKDMTAAEVGAQVPERIRDVYQGLREGGPSWHVERDRCFLEIRYGRRGEQGAFDAISPSIAPWGRLAALIRDIIHVPGLRGNPARTYPVTAVGKEFPGTFERYVAGIVTQWQRDGDAEKLRALSRDLQDLALTWKVVARPISDTEVELQVGRLARAAQGGAYDLVSIADVGFGVSQTLPVLVALQVAKPGQLVYLEQPEIHLHPHAQHAMAGVIAGAAKRGVRVVVETHSSLLLLGLQTLVAKGAVPAEDVALHWFQRSVAGDTTVASADVSEDGSFGEWPEDFGAVILEAEAAYLNTPTKR